MRVVVDENVLVSGLISPFGPPGVMVGLAATGTIQLCYDARIIAEYHTVLERPAFAFRRRDIETLLPGIAAGGVAVAPAPLPRRTPETSPFWRSPFQPVPHSSSRGTFYEPSSSKRGISIARATTTIRRS